MINTNRNNMNHGLRPDTNRNKVQEGRKQEGQPVGGGCPSDGEHKRVRGARQLRAAVRMALRTADDGCWGRTSRRTRRRRVRS